MTAGGRSPFASPCAFWPTRRRDPLRADMRALTSVCAIARVPTRRPEPDLLDRLLVTSGHTSSEPGDDPALGANGGDKIRGIRRAEAYRRRDDRIAGECGGR